LPDSLASVIIVTYNHRSFIGACIDSVQRQDYPFEIIVVDNESTDGTPEFIRGTYPAIQLIRNENTGYGAGNNLGVRYAKGEYVVVLNPDTIVEKDWLRNLISPIQPDPAVITTPKILLYDGSAINTCGNINHFTGLTFTRGLNEPPESWNREIPVSGVSGACFAIKRDTFLRFGGFDERFFLYNEDSELSWRAYRYHCTIRYVPSSVVRHNYSLSVIPGKIYHLEKGRYLILKEYLSPKFALIFLPSLLTAELLTFGYALSFGREGLSAKCRAISEGIRLPKDSPEYIDSRVLTHLEEKIPDDQLVGGILGRGFVRLCNVVFSWNFAVFRGIFG